MRPVNKMIVLGGGSAGFLAALTAKIKLPELEIKIIRSPDIGIIGVGEGTVWTMPVFLHGYLGIDPRPFHQTVRPTYKLGIRYLWGPRPRFHYSFDRQFNWHYDALPKPNGYYCDELFDYASNACALMEHNRAFAVQQDGGPVIDTTSAYHLENETFVRFLEDYATRQLGIEIVDDTVQEVEQDAWGVRSLILESGQREVADLYLDCSGFRSRLLAGAFGEEWVSFESTLFCDRAVVGGWQRTNEPLLAFTTAETMDAGWCWQIEHDNWINRGYVYSSSFLSDDEAEAEFRKKNPKIESTRLLRFRSGRYRRFWRQNVVAIGNASGFVEPLEATALWLICKQLAEFVNVLRDGEREVETEQIDAYNRSVALWWDSVRRFLAVHYKFNTRVDTPFWQQCHHHTDLAGGEDFVNYYQAVGPSTNCEGTLGKDDMFGLEGWLAMMVGQQVPYKRKYQPSQRDWEQWRYIHQGVRDRARTAMRQEDGLRIIRAPDWNWNLEYFRRASPWNPR